MMLLEINAERDDLIRAQRRGPGDLFYPILSLCCHYARSERVHRSCQQKLCACPCHKENKSPAIEGQRGVKG